MSTQNKSNLITKTGIVLGVIGILFALLPLLSGWFLFVSWLGYVLGFIGLIFAIISCVKKQRGAIVAIIINVLAFAAPIALAEVYLEKSLESASNAMEATMKLTNGISDLTNNNEGAENEEVEELFSLSLT